ncbi:hypothetical protein FACS1894137_14620 [Spirochaetia bacterium]|nr:hypothetical protein FACS1894137_14620 [Spirochaetia bacterium]
MCSKCRYMASSGKPGGGAEVEGVDDVRGKNFTRIIEILKQKFSRCNTVLDVGCSHGVFLKIAQDAGFFTMRAEPEGVFV